jgi:hypothetical protein
MSSITQEGIPELVDYLIDNYGNTWVEEVSEDLTTDLKPDLVVFDLRQNHDPKKVKLEYLWDMKFKASWERLEQIVRMTDFENPEALMRVYNVMDKMWVVKMIEKDLEKLTNNKKIDNSFFFEWNNESEDFSPKIEIAWKIINLDKLRYNL